MLLGKRPRPPMKRTTSMTELALDLSIGEASLHQPSDPSMAAGGHGRGRIDQRVLAASAISPRLHRQNSAALVETSHFLRACSLCKRRLVPGRDIYMYKGDSAFCSPECRQNQMNQDEGKEKCSLPSKKEATPAAAAGAGSDGSTKGETLAAA